MSIPPPPPGQGPVDPRGAFSPPPPPMPGMYPPMPMPMMMPPPFYPPPPPQRGGGLLRSLFVAMVTSVFGLSIALNVYLILLSGLLSGEAPILERVIVSGDPSQRIAVVAISGIIDAAASERFDRIMRELEKDSSVKALVVELDTPGGGVTPSDEIYARILKFREKRGVPVAATIASLGASGGYYIACGAEHIFAETTSITGSIGVLMQNFNIHEMLQEWGVKDTTIVADGATYKTAGGMTTPVRPEDEAYFKEMVNRMFDRFKQVVKDGRGTKVTDINAVANGKIFTAQEAKDLGLIDSIDYPAAAYTWAATKAGAGRMHVVRYDLRPPSLFEVLGSRAGVVPGANGSGTTINGINLNVDRAAIDHLTTPRLMYLWRGY